VIELRAASGLLDLRKDGTYIYYSVNREMARKYAPYLLE